MREKNKEELWKELTSQRKDKEAKFTDFVKEWRQLQEEKFSREEETEAEKNLLHKGENMIKSENRLRKNRQFLFIYKHGQASHTRTLSVVFVKTKTQPNKIGFSVSKKVGKSVVRSKVKRRMTEAFNQIQKHVDTNFNYVFIAKPEIVEITFFEIVGEMKRVLKKAKLYNEEIS